MEPFGQRSDTFMSTWLAGSPARRFANPAPPPSGPAFCRAAHAQAACAPPDRHRQRRTARKVHPIGHPDAPRSLSATTLPPPSCPLPPSAPATPHVPPARPASALFCWPAHGFPHSHGAGWYRVKVSGALRRPRPYPQELLLSSRGMRTLARLRGRPRRSEALRTIFHVPRCKTDRK